MPIDVFLIVFAGFFGVIIGSFLNVIALRYQTRQSALYGRSFCPACKKQLAWWELVPIVSYVLLRGRCVGCQKPIAWAYPLTEFISGLGTVFLVLALGLNLLLLPALISYWTAIVIWRIDLRLLLIPDEAVLVIFLAGVIWQVLQGTLSTGFVGAVAGGLFPLSLVLITRGKGMGLGDVKLGAALGLLAGWPGVVVVWFAAVILGAVYGLVAIAAGKSTLKTAVPFAPFLLLGAGIAMIWGEKIVTWYLQAWNG